MIASCTAVTPNLLIPNFNQKRSACLLVLTDALHAVEEKDPSSEGLAKAGGCTELMRTKVSL